MASLPGSGDHFCHSFGLAQVHSSVEKGPVGKFAAARGLSPRRDAGRQDLVYDSLAAMALYFGAVLPRICVRRGHEDTEDIIQRLSFRIEHTAVARFQGTNSSILPEAGRNILRTISREAGPERRTIAMAPLPWAVAWAAMVVSPEDCFVIPPYSGFLRIMTTRFLAPSP